VIARQAGWRALRTSSPALLERVLNGHVVGFHQMMTTSRTGGPHGGLLDTVKLTYASLEFENLDGATEATCTVPPPPHWSFGS
jgi:hypothetical protein